jgi:hypothetical protein
MSPPARGCFLRRRIAIATQTLVLAQLVKRGSPYDCKLTAYRAQLYPSFGSATPIRQIN